jgi:hypothetical protein
MRAVCHGWRSVLEAQEAEFQKIIDAQSAQLEATKVASGRVLTAAEQLQHDTQNLVRKNISLQTQVNELDARNRRLEVQASMGPSSPARVAWQRPQRHNVKQQMNEAIRNHASEQVPARQKSAPVLNLLDRRSCTSLGTQASCSPTSTSQHRPRSSPRLRSLSPRRSPDRDWRCRISVTPMPPHAPGPITRTSLEMLSKTCPPTSHCTLRQESCSGEATSHGASMHKICEGAAHTRSARDWQSKKEMSLQACPDPNFPPPTSFDFSPTRGHVHVPEDLSCGS